jgi:uncharacterized repeat protein (TIGR01451 family)
VSWDLGGVTEAEPPRDLTVSVRAGDGQDGDVDNNATVHTTTSDPNPGNDGVAVTTHISPGADLSISKSAGTAVAGGQLVYTITVVNNGPATAQDVVVTDSLPAGVTFFSASDGGTESNGTVTWSLGSFAVADSPKQLTLTVTVDPDRTADIVNTATATSTTGDPDPGNNGGSTTTTVGQSADLRVTKTADESVTAGTDLVYTITVDNLGPSAAHNVVVTDTIPAGTTYVSATPASSATYDSGTVTWSLGTVRVADSPVTLTLTVRVDPGRTDPVLNSATGTSSTPDPNTGNGSGSTTTQVGGRGNVTVVKSTPDDAVAGQDLTYTLVIDNEGPSDARNVVVTDTIPAGATFVSATPASIASHSGSLVTWTVGPVRVADPPVQLTLTVHVDPSVTEPIHNCANATADTTDPDGGEGCKTTTVHASPRLTLVKSVVGGSATPDQWTLTAGGSGGFSGAGGSAAVTSQIVTAGVQYTLSESGGPGEYTSTGVWSCDGGSFASPDTITLAVDQAATCTITNTLKPAPQLTISKACPGGKTVATDRFQPRNNGVDVGAALDCGDSATITLTPDAGYAITEVGAGSPAASLASYTTAYSASCTDAQGLPRGAPTPTCTITNTKVTAPVAGIKYEDANGNHVKNGAETAPAVGFVIRAYVDANGIDGLQAGETTIAASATTSTSTGAYGLTLSPGKYVLCEVAQAGWTQTQPDPAGNNRCSAVSGLAPAGYAVNVTSAASIPGNDFGNLHLPTPTITKSQRDCRAIPLTCSGPSNPLTVNLGDTIRYTLTVANGPTAGPATNVIVRDAIPPGLTVTAVTPPAGTSCSASPVRCVVTALAPGAQVAIVVEATVPKPCDIVGTAGNDTLNGTSAAETICGLGGSDTITGGGGNDTIWGDTPFPFTLPGPFVNTAWLDANNNNTVDAGEASASATAAAASPGAGGGDTISGDAGADNIFGQEGNDSISGNSENDRIGGGVGNDGINGDAGADTVNGDDGDDNMNGGDGADTVNGGNGNDVIAGDTPGTPGAAGDTIDGGTGDDRISGYDGVDTIDGGDGADTIFG